MMVAKNYLVDPKRGNIEDIKIKRIFHLIFIKRLPISSATFESSFSATRNLKTLLRIS